MTDAFNPPLAPPCISDRELTIKELGAKLAKALHEEGIDVTDRNFEPVAAAAAKRLDLSDNLCRLVAVEASIVSHAILDGVITAEEIS